MFTAREITRISDAGILSIDLGYVTPASTAPGSHEGEHATMVVRAANGELRRGRIMDVYLASIP